MIVNTKIIQNPNNNTFGRSTFPESFFNLIFPSIFYENFSIAQTFCDKHSNLQLKFLKTDKSWVFHAIYTIFIGRNL